MHKSDRDNEPCGVRLVRLINTQSLEIAKREVANRDRMCLYGTGEYWHGFEHSAYFLSRIFPDLESFVVNNPSFPFSVVGVSVPDKDFRKYLQNHIASRQDEDYLEFAVDTFNPSVYQKWHTETVQDFLKVVNGD